jgi:hypothetical protein
MENKNLFGGDDRHIMFLISPISSYCNDLIKTLSPERILMQQVSEYQALTPELCLYSSFPFCRIACDISLTYCCLMSRGYSTVFPNMFDIWQHIVSEQLFSLMKRKKIFKISGEKIPICQQ